MSDDSKLRVTSITVEWGTEYHQPVQFNGFNLGAISMAVDVPPDVPASRVHAWAVKQLKAMSKKQFEERLAEYQANNRTAKR